MLQEAMIVAYGRSAVGKAPKGKLKCLRPDELAAQVLKGTLNKLPDLDPALIDDFILGCAFPEAEQGMNLARTVWLRSGLPQSVSAHTVNRFCSSGLQSIAAAANSIMAGQADMVLAGGVESMSTVPMGGNLPAPNPYLMEHAPEAHMSMGLTAENVAAKYNISREEQDHFAYESHIKAAAAQREGRFARQIIPIESVSQDYDREGRPGIRQFIFDQDEGIRENISRAALGSLRAVFKSGGSVTAGNSSQTSDGAAMVLLMSRAKAKQLGIRPIARFVSHSTAGVDPALMGIGPVAAIPKALRLAGISQNEAGLMELNEAFASQALACIKLLGLRPDSINVNGGAIALGHPLGCTGSFLTVKLLDEMVFRKERYGLVSMCIGGGMGAAAVFELI